MSQPAEPRFESISPFFGVEDVQAALRFSCESLGFALGWQWGEPATQAHVCRDRMSLSLAAQPSAAGSGNVYVQRSGVDAYCAQLSDRGVEVGPLARRDYGMRDVLVVDPWGNRLVFGEPS